MSYGLNYECKKVNEEMMRVYVFTCGTRIFFPGEDGNYFIEEPGRTLTFFGLLENQKWEFVNMSKTYEEWLDQKKTVNRGEYTEILFKVIVDNSEEEYKKGLKYEEEQKKTIISEKTGLMGQSKNL